jgi:hypothetical protein
MLTQVQKRLEDHFAALSYKRAHYRYPVYGLEHGLEPSDIEAIRRELGRIQRLQHEHWLLWIVIAAEVGYSYDGDEYWRSFAAAVPGWPSFGDRGTMRDWFKTFGSRFSGFTPSGRWAEHFSIIAWPIAHSILPRYLQSQFAEHLYEIRYDLARRGELEISQLGLLVKEKYHGASSRFENFLQQTELTARVVLALRDEDVQDIVPPVHGATLARIVADLERRQSARDQLREARSVLRAARIRGTADLAGRLDVGHRSQRETAENRGGNCTAKLVARRATSGEWVLGVALPDFVEIMHRSGATPKALDKTRIRFADKPEVWLPGRALSSFSSQLRPMVRLPEPFSRTIIEFEHRVTGLSDLISADLHLQDSPPWLLRIHEDGEARQLLGRQVRSGQTYLVVARDPISNPLARELDLQQQDCRTTGAVLYLLKMSLTTGNQRLQALTQLGLGYVLRARVEPVGLMPRWDASIGGSVWLPSEEILLRLSADFDISEFGISLNGQHRTRVPIAGHNETLVSLGDVPIGVHVVEVVAIRADPRTAGGTLPQIDPERLVFDVRAPLPWRQDVRRQAGFRVFVLPAGASFDDLLSDKATVCIQGPPDRIAVVEARTFDTNGYPLESFELGRLTLPVNREAMRRLIEKLRIEPLSEKCQSAPRIDVAVLVDELGASYVTFHQTVEPVRWRLETRGRRYAVWLIDEAGAEKDIVVERQEIQTPDQLIAMQLQECLEGLQVEPPGSLFVAHHQKRLYPAIVSVFDTASLTALTDLGVNITLTAPSDSPHMIVRLLALRRRWRHARPLGVLARVRKANVLDAFELQIARMTCGVNWADAARDCRQGKIRLLDRLQRDVGGSPGFASRMRTTSWDLTNREPANSEFIRLARTYQISDDADLCELALRLAFDPDGLRFPDPEKGRTMFKRLAANPPLARGAFLAKLAADINAYCPLDSIESVAS